MILQETEPLVTSPRLCVRVRYVDGVPHWGPAVCCRFLHTARVRVQLVIWTLGVCVYVCMYIKRAVVG